MSYFSDKIPENFYPDDTIPDSKDGRRKSNLPSSEEHFNVRNGDVFGEEKEGDYTDLKEIRDHHKEIVNLLACGIRPFDIARQLNLCNQTVIRVSNNPIIREMVEILQYERADNAADIAQALSKLAPNAIELLDEVINFRSKQSNGGIKLLCGDPDLSDQIQSSLNLLKIIVPKKHIETRSQFVSADMLRQIKDNSLQAKAEEVSYEDVPA